MPNETKNKKSENRIFYEKVCALVAQIPKGCVASYGQLALLAGRPRGARMAGRVMRYAQQGLPCHRVVNHAGRTAPGWAEQRGLLEAEGVTFLQSGCVAMKQCGWRPGPSFAAGESNEEKPGGAEALV